MSLSSAPLGENFCPSKGTRPQDRLTVIGEATNHEQLLNIRGTGVVHRRAQGNLRLPHAYPCLFLGRFRDVSKDRSPLFTRILMVQLNVGRTVGWFRQRVRPIGRIQVGGLTTRDGITATLIFGPLVTVMVNGRHFRAFLRNRAGVDHHLGVFTELSSQCDAGPLLLRGSTLIRVRRPRVPHRVRPDLIGENRGEGE